MISIRRAVKTAATTSQSRPAPTRLLWPESAKADFAPLLLRIHSPGHLAAGLALVLACVIAMPGSAQGVQQKPAEPQWKPPEIVELDEQRKPAIQTKGDCFIHGGTILTVTQGVIKDGSILVKSGKIAAIGKDL